MTEDYLLNKTLDLINESGTLEAYQFLVSNSKALESKSSQIYNFLYCLASTSDKKEEALNWLEEAIITNVLWYRPAVFEDDDLDALRNEPRFQVCVEKSNKRYQFALANAQSICSWTEKKRDTILLTLHGNQQNIKLTKPYWETLEDDKIQVEYIQSEELDSYDLYRWEDHGSGPKQLLKAMNKIEWDQYSSKLLGGFSSGCNVILRAIEELDITCDKLILQSPWLPILDEKMDSIVSKLKSKGIEVLIICGTDDEDCFPRCKQLVNKAHEIGLKIQSLFSPNLGHEYPSDFREIVANFTTPVNEVANILDYYKHELNWNPPFADILSKYSPEGLKGYLTMRESVQNGHLPKKTSELIFTILDSIDDEVSGAKAHAVAAIDAGLTIEELVEAFMIVTIVKGINVLCKAGVEAIKAAEERMAVLYK